MATQGKKKKRSLRAKRGASEETHPEGCSVPDLQPAERRGETVLRFRSLRARRPGMAAWEADGVTAETESWHLPAAQGAARFLEHAVSAPHRALAPDGGV